MARTKVALAAARNARTVRARLLEDMLRLCQDAGVTQQELARQSGVAQSYISRILNGAATPSLETYARLVAPLDADLSARIYPNTGPAIRDRHSVRILEGLLGMLHARWHAFMELRVHRPSRGWIDLGLHEARERLLLAGEIQSTLERIEQLIRWSTEKADSIPSWNGWPHLGEAPTVSRLLVVRWTTSTREAAKAAERQLRIAYPAHPDDAIAALTGTAPWPGPALIWARTEGDGVRLASGR